MNPPVNIAKPMRAVTFDIGGTLLFPHPYVGAVYAEVLADHGFDSDPAALEAGFIRAWKAAGASGSTGQTGEAMEREQWFRIVESTLSDVLPEDRMRDIFRKIWDTFAEFRRWRIREHTREVLAALQNGGIRTAVLSNWDSRLRPLLADAGLDRQFDRLFISAEIGWKKPHPRVFDIVASDLNVAPEHLLHVGDSVEHDIRPAQAAGWNAVLIRDDPESASDHPTIRDLREILDMTLQPI